MQASFMVRAPLLVGPPHGRTDAIEDKSNVKDIDDAVVVDVRSVVIQTEVTNDVEKIRGINHAAPIGIREMIWASTCEKGCDVFGVKHAIAVEVGRGEVGQVAFVEFLKRDAADREGLAAGVPGIAGGAKQAVVTAELIDGEKVGTDEGEVGGAYITVAT
ncbi:MAG: hypothetical protein AAF297_12295, partial [Planctomycetota bacterium]